MKRKTFVQYFKLISASLCVMTAVSVFTVVEHYLFNSNEKVSEITTMQNESITIIIDAGHGGEDGGAVGISGVLEKDINLSIARYLSSYLAMTDIDVVMTRTDDKMLYKAGQESSKKTYDIRNRKEIADYYVNPVFVSIHQNKFPLEKYKGFQVYYSPNHADSKVLAEFIQNKTVLNLQKDNNRKVKKSGRNIYLLHRLNCPAVLVECGFLSNPTEEKMLSDEEYQQKLAFVIFSAILEYSANTQSEESL